jgi:hypothetical protein
LNQAIKQEVSSLASTKHPATLSPDNLNIDSIIASVDKELWTFIENLTASQHEDTCCSLQMQHVKKVRRLFALSVLLFTVDTRCTPFLQVLLSEAVDACNGSTNLMGILNRLGATASKDTHDRYLKAVAEKTKTSTQTNLHPQAFCVASFDNIDKNSPHAQVYVGSQRRGWHGTSVQAVEPSPTRILLEPQELVSEETASENVRTPTLQDIKLSETEKSELEKLQTQVYSYMMEQQLLEGTDKQVRDLKSFAALNADKLEVEVSNVTHVAILDLPADTTQTVEEVLHQLHTEFQIGTRLKSLVVVCNYKSYNRIKELKLRTRKTSTGFCHTQEIGIF